MKWRTLANGEKQVLVKWKGYDEMTWESAERLREDIGYQNFLGVPRAAELPPRSWSVADGKSVGEVFDCRPPEFYTVCGFGQVGEFENMDGDETEGHKWTPRLRIGRGQGREEGRD